MKTATTLSTGTTFPICEYKVCSGGEPCPPQWSYKAQALKLLRSDGTLKVGVAYFWAQEGNEGFGDIRGSEEDLATRVTFSGGQI